MAPSAAMAGTSGLSAYLQARAADADGRVDVAVAAYAQALAADPADPVLAIRAYREGIEAGDMALVDRAARVLNAAGVAPADAALFPLAEAARKGNASAASAAVATLAKGPLVVLAPSLYGWIAHAEGQDPTPALATAARDPVANRFAAETRALLANATRKQALAIGVSRLLGRLAGDLVGGEPSPLSVALAQAALLADPGFDRNRVVLAAGLARNAIVDRALAVLDGVDPKGAFADAAMNQRIDILLNADREPEALALASARAEAKTAAVADWQRYADLLVTTNDPVAAARWYGKVVAANDATWSAWLQYGGALDQAGRWPEARVALARAVAQAPTEPLALNYLGFAQIEHGDDIAASTGMLERATRLDPQNASITDSLGWAYHLSGRTPRALPLLERAAQAEPTSMEISDHLGDAYWTVGRRYEARYAWRAASLTAEAKDMPRIADKIANGLPGAARR